ncbi:phytanoyl-CoA dioxygenase family protein [Roseivirga pacifica]
MKYFISEFKYVFNELLHNEEVQDEFYDDIKTNGYCVIKDFLTKDQCETYRQLIDDGIEKYESVADDEKSDYRIFGIDRLIPEIRNVFARPVLESLYKKYVDRNQLNSFIMANRVTPKPGNLGSGGGWHRDSINRRQLKFIVYLSDVGSVNGNFQYMPKSHRVWDKLGQNRSLKKGLSEYRYSQEDIDTLVKNGNRVDELTGSQGTLIVADTSGIHRGKPIVEGVRYAMTNYMFDHKIPVHIENLLLK